MVIDKIWYAPPGHNNSCAPVSIYSMIHSNLVNEGASIGADLITIDGVGNSLSMNARGTFSRTFGSGLSEANIQKISRTVSRGLSKLGMEIDFKLRTDTIGLPDGSVTLTGHDPVFSGCYISGHSCVFDYRFPFILS